MDLVTLVTACALSVEPKLMHALIWHQSGGEPWAVAVQNEPMSRVYSSMQDAVSEVHSISIASDTVRVGLAGLPVSPLKANAAMFLPCRNVAIAAQRIARLADRCKAHPRLRADPTFCAVAVYRGSWQRPDVKFADAVATTVAKGDAPNVDMPKDANIELLDIGSETLPPSNDSPFASGSAFEERERGWSSALFPSNPQQSRNESGNALNDHQADRAIDIISRFECASIDRQLADRPFVCPDIIRSQTTMTGMHAHRSNSQDIAPMAKKQCGGGQPTERWQDKSREVRGVRSAGKRVMIKDLAQCAPVHQSLPIRTSHCQCEQMHTSRSERDGTRR